MSSARTITQAVADLSDGRLGALRFVFAIHALNLPQEDCAAVIAWGCIADPTDRTTHAEYDAAFAAFERVIAKVSGDNGVTQ